MIRRVFQLTLTVLLAYAGVQAHAQLTINTSTASDWQISNGTLTMDWDSTTGNLWSMYLNGTNLVDQTTLGGDGHPDGLYMDDTGQGTGTATASYHLSSGHYLDWWLTVPSSSTNAFTYTQHWFLFPNDSTLYVYFVVAHSATDIAGTMGQVQYVNRISQTLFTNTYSNNSGLNNLGVTEITLPSPTVLGNSDPGRAVSNAVTDLHGLTIPSGFGREFYTKYDYSSFEYLHQVHGLYGSTWGCWTTIPSTETLVGGPTKQDLIFTGTIDMMEALSNHLDNSLGYTPPQGTATSRLFGPYGYHYNEINGTLTTPADLYQDAVSSIATDQPLFNNETILLDAGYTPQTTAARGNVEPFISGGGSSTANVAWAVLSDQNKNFQYSSNGLEYWTSNNSNGDATIYNAVPGTYRLSAYVLGEWGELREDGVTVTANSTNSLHGLTFTPENFGSAASIWTIGTPDRSAHEFLHGKNSSGQDDREYWGNWNYWSDFSANSGAVIYYATAVGSHAATNNLNDWNYVQWGQFDPGLFGGYYSSGDDTTDGYTYIVPSYVKNLSGSSGTNGVTTPVPPWQVYFTTTSAQLAQGSYVELSVGLAAAEGSLTASLNGHALTWHYTNSSDAMVRSGLSGTYQWVVFEFPTSELAAAGASNELLLSVSQDDGVMYDALRMEISSTTANPSTTNWHDYTFINASTTVLANDTVANNN